MAVAWCPDWPVVAWGVPLDEPVAVVVANRVVATSPAARVEGVAVGQRRRDAQGRCPEIAILDRDIDREVRLFEPVAVALEAITPRVEVAGPGLVGFPTLGPSRFLGGDAALAEQMIEVISPVLAGRGGVRIGIADGEFSARLAARSVEASSGPILIPPDESAAFLADLPIGVLAMPQLSDVLGRLGLSTLGRFAALSASDVLGRFGRDGMVAHRLANGEDHHPPDLRRPAPDLAVTWVFDPPAERVERCAFVVKSLADDLHETLGSNGLACVRIAIEVETEKGDCHIRLWRHEGALSAGAMAERARWQLDAWDSGSGIHRLSLIPDEVVPATGRQLGFWGGRAERADDVTRAVARIQALLGSDAVTVPERRGGRGPGEQIRMIPAAAVDLGEERVATGSEWVDEPWPGAVPRPSPAAVHADPAPIQVVDGAGRPVGVSGRGEVTHPPESVTLPQARPRQVTGWAGPWPADEFWWDPLRHRRRARLQVTLDDDSAHLLMVEQSTWFLEASYQ